MEPSLIVGNHQADTGPFFVDYLDVENAGYEFSTFADTEMMVINLCSSETMFAANSDRMRPLFMPKHGSVFVPQGTEMKERSDPSTCEIVVISILGTEKFETSLADQYPRNHAEYRNDFRDVALGRLAEEMRRFFLTGRLEGTAYLEHLVWSYCLRQFALISNSLPNEKANKLTVAQARQTEEFLDASLEGEVSLADLADHLDLPVMPLNHGIRECFGAPFHQVLLEKRVARARHLLSQSEASIADIAYACGFSSQQHMTNVFSKRLGVSHGKYRKLQ